MILSGKYLWLLLPGFMFIGAMAQVPAGQVARFTFNDQAAADEITGEKVKLVGVKYSKDRFGNRGNAINLNGDLYSYVNLGKGTHLKQEKATISMWVRLDNAVYSGKGYMANPLLLTKSTKRSDFYEAYAFYYDLDGNKFGVSISRDSLRQVVLLDMDSANFNRWYHLAMTYDDDFIAFFVDGQLVNRHPKGYRTVFEPSDSVIIGVSNNAKNNRYSRGTVDDIFFYDRVLSDSEIEGLYNAPDPNRNNIYIRWGLVALSLLGLLAALYFFLRYRISLAHRKEKQKLELQNVMLETELRVNRALMNPHFVFNSMNTLQNFILKDENDRANSYLVRFSKLMRQVLESNMTNSITLATEVELLQRYLEIEDMRFEENIRHEVTVAADISPTATKIPIMMIQPFVENAIWHGLLKKEGDKKLTVSFTRVNGSAIRCTVDDNGSGRKKAGPDLSENRSLAIKFIEQRIDLLNRIHKMNCALKITDKPNGGGTTVCIDLPILN